MNTEKSNLIYPELSFKIIGLAMEVHRVLGYGFLEKVYENALMVLCERDQIPARQQATINVHFLGHVVGEFVADILIEDKIILELKSCESLSNAHRAQALNYLKATGLKLAILINFGKKSLEYERIVL